VLAINGKAKVACMLLLLALSLWAIVVGRDRISISWQQVCQCL